MINKKKLSALLLTGTMILSMGTSVFAGDNIPNVNTDGKVSITKDFEISEGLSIPNTTFEFTATPITTDAPTATINAISYSNVDDKGALDNGRYTISKNSEITFGEFKHAGVYEYTVKETCGSLDGITYSTAQYTLRVYVANRNNDLYVKNITADDGTGKKEKVLFTNTYTKNNASLTIEKNTTGDLADKTKEFEFYITFTKSPMSSQTTFTGKSGKNTITCKDGIEQKFTLKDSQQLVFENLPVGTRYVVKEKGIQGDGYTPAITVIENGSTTVSAMQGNEAEDLSSAKVGNTNLVGENDNKVTFINTYNDTPITGIIMNNLPFIVVIAVAISALVALAFIKKQRIARK